jgi:hypothetical protein
MSNELISSKITTSIASRSLIVTDPQHNKTHFDTTQPRLDQNPSQVSTNHVKVHATCNYDHGCYNSFTLCRGCTCSPSIMIIIGSRIPIVQMEYPYTLLRCALGNHYRAFQLFHLACNGPIEASPPVWASNPTRSPLLCLMDSIHRSFTHTIPRFSHSNFSEHPSGSAIASSMHSRFVRQD